MTDARSLSALLERLLGLVGRKPEGARQPRRPESAGATPEPAGATPKGVGSGASAPPAYPGDFAGPLPDIRYAPRPDGRPDPGEIVWAWVPFQEDTHRGKDRPVLLIAWDGDWLLALPLTSKDHDRDAAQERAAGRIWVDIGSGAWDRRGRPSEVGVHRIIRIDPTAIRREGSVLAAERFAAVVTALVHVHGRGV